MGNGIYFKIAGWVNLRGEEIKKKIFLETSGPIATKLLWNDPWMAPFQKSVR
jgi:hypothetical protein